MPRQVYWLAGRRCCLAFPASHTPVTRIDSRSPLTGAGTAPELPIATHRLPSKPQILCSRATVTLDTVCEAAPGVKPEFAPRGGRGSRIPRENRRRTACCFDWPQRQRVTRFRTSYSAPSADSTTIPPRTQMGPLTFSCGSCTKAIDGVQHGLQRLAGRLVDRGVATRRTQAALVDDDLGGLSRVFADTVPHGAVSVTEPRLRAQLLDVGDVDARAEQHLGTILPRLGARRLGAVEPDVHVRAVAERLRFGLAAATQAALLTIGQLRLDAPRLGFALRVHGDRLRPTSARGPSRCTGRSW